MTLAIIVVFAFAAFLIGFAVYALTKPKLRGTTQGKALIAMMLLVGGSMLAVLAAMNIGSRRTYGVVSVISALAAAAGVLIFYRWGRHRG